MKRNGDIASLFRKHRAKKIASSSSPSSVGVVAEEQTQEQEGTPEQERVIEEIVNLMPSSPPSVPLEDVSPLPPIYDINRLPHDPGERLPIVSYPINDQDAIRRAYSLKGPFQPYAHDFAKRKIGNRDRQFTPLWFHKYHWLEYSIKKESVFCFVCYLFKNEKSKGKGTDAFIKGGWRNWNRGEEALDKHVGGVTSVHNAAQERYNLFINPSAAIDNQIVKLNNEDLRLYKIRLTYSLRCLKFLLHQGLAFRGHDENEESSNRGNFLELLNWLAANSEEVNKYVLKNAPVHT
ncbi:uncharacterized protein LOC133905803 isoform X2 [Phragmites australis]|uniref:uncharacterized protein LOC133905803 isoform X2 n=1 Tax=Phragmites australis TaxID=29695 RepID=UPI002D79B65B|nr:uncharacterized protein LOC133905803 isoform X2 [Phragmites australis]